MLNISYNFTQCWKVTKKKLFLQDWNAYKSVENITALGNEKGINILLIKSRTLEQVAMGVGVDSGVWKLAWLKIYRK